MECTIVQYVVFLNVTVLFIVFKHCVQRLYHDLILFRMSTNNKYKKIVNLNTCTILIMWSDYSQLDCQFKTTCKTTFNH